MNVDIDEIRRMLDAITPGVWSQQSTFNIYTDVGTDHEELVVVLEEFRPTDGEFIAAAPQIVRTLLALIDTYQRGTAIATDVVDTMKAYLIAQTTFDRSAVDSAGANLANALNRLDAFKAELVTFAAPDAPRDGSERDAKESVE